MDFKYTSRLGRTWSTESLKSVLEKLGVKTLEDAIKQEREKVKAEGFKPIEIEPSPASIENKPSPIRPKPRLPYADTDETF